MLEFGVFKKSNNVKRVSVIIFFSTITIIFIIFARTIITNIYDQLELIAEEFLIVIRANASLKNKDA